MSRALRRQQLISKPPAKSPGFKPSGPRPQKKTQTAAQVEAARKRSLFDRVFPGFVRDIINELKKVTWPTRDETVRLTVAVIFVSVAIGSMLGGVDLGFNWLVEKTLLR
ncbi:MAG TPA: preprotein translocase subunit SecE [Dehalococcoidia bacterium]|jgi:preprotein translocase subunit SecE|nr:preprotein translocase subunit SecE [Dehalococcoidia bacterium]